MKFSIFRIIIAIITFSIGVSFVLIFTALRRTNDVTNVNVPEVQIVPSNLPDLPEFTVTIKPVPEFIFDYDPTEFYPRGYYSIIGKMPKELREFEGFELAAYEWDAATSNDQVMGSVLIQTFSNKIENYSYTVTGSVTEKNLKFIAVPQFEEDFEYRFNGHFLKGGRVYKAGKNQAVLKGKLTKLKNGVKVAEREVKFRVEYLGC